MIRLRNQTAGPIQLDGRVLFPGQTLEYPASIAKYATVQRLIRSGSLRLVED
ncbi:hypothetical protein DIBBI_gp11 [Xanthomonas phage vB_XveM_DIBBI]|uniref:Uncharacterized protein n=3 Tax=Dibbivirus TaxID=2843374 RepID=A0A513ZYL6_9CAUD|nr:hypothetical protein DIBBI_gp11 [Xanthomonas phage vB_XveM_DIBBI]YP_009845859.1 hypothetical protein HWC22_gp11 [Pantoea phage vB_PagM_AAM37]YP_009845945.1 hypothetical protein HWC23_gp11 [Pantoea phage vB_PagM_PSKM]AEX65679.1 hypothetical protein DIBBI_011 [Xanthomonas phage vB_XveM_DIBBI]QDH45682.1 hypothetical protein AAM37_gp11 [Pantoea phage vB_PagM_AAM37]QDH45768.1 hypothetical protein PSKM_gp11 [Pantoea phage vB_PagM_PSKM]